MPLSWNDLRHTARRERLQPDAALHANEQGEIGPEFPPAAEKNAAGVQMVRGLFQFRRARENSMPEGEVQEATPVFYCNFLTQRSGEKTDIANPQTGTVDRLVIDGVQWRVTAVSDEGGQGDHLKVFLKADGLTGDA